MRLVYLSPVPWGSFDQRPHHFVRWFHDESGGEVLWIDPYPTRLPRLDDWRGAPVSATSEPKAVPAWMKVVRPSALPVEPLPGSGAFNRLIWRTLRRTVARFTAGSAWCLGIGKPSKLALQLLAAQPTLSLLDVMDDFPAFYDGISRRAMGHTQDAIATRVDRIFVSSTSLFEFWAERFPNVTAVLNGCASGDLPPVARLAPLSNQRVLGYVGTVGRWFDWRWIGRVAQAHPQATIRIVGPIYVGSSEVLPRNVELLPACTHAEAIDVMQTFSVGLIPFLCNQLTASVDPIKYYEYRALGLPVISAPFGEMARRDSEPGVILANADADLAAAVARVRGHRDDPAAIAAFRNRYSWRKRFGSSALKVDFACGQYALPIAVQ